MQETEKIWMNGELVDWADARVHVGAHGLHYGTGVFEGIRCYETERGPGRLPARRPPASGSRPRRSCSTWSSRTRSRSSARRCHELIAVNGLPECYLRPIAFYGYGELGVHTRRRTRSTSSIMSWPWGTYLGEEALSEAASARRSPPGSASARTRSRTPPRRPASTSTRCSPTHEAQPRRLRRGDPAHRRRLRRRRLGRERSSWSRTASIFTPDLSASILPGITRDTIIQIAQRPRLHGRREAADPHRPLHRRRGLHDRHGRRGDAGPLGRRPRDRRPGPVTLRAPAGVPRHRARPQPSAGRTGSTTRRATPAPRRDAGRQRGRDPALRRRTSTSARRSSCSRCCARAGSRSGRWIDRFEEALAERVGAPYAAAVSSGTAGLHLCCAARRRRAGRRGDHVAVLVRRLGELLHLRGRDAGLRRRRPADAEPRPGRGRGGDHAAHEGDRRRRHLRLPVRARRRCASSPTAHGLALIEDACEALGAEYKGRPLGSHGQPAVFAFYPNKQMTTGRGRHRRHGTPRTSGACSRASRNQGRADARRLARARAARLQLPPRRPRAPRSGSRSSRSSTGSSLGARRRSPRATRSCSRGVDGVEPPLADDADHERSWFVYVVRLAAEVDRERVIAALDAERASRRAATCPSIHLQPYMRERFGFARGHVPGRPRTRAGGRSRSRSTPELDADDQERVVDGARARRCESAIIAAMADGAPRMVFLGFGKYARADKIYALEPITATSAGSGRRTRVWVEGIAEPIVASRTERTILHDMGQDDAAARRSSTRRSSSPSGSPSGGAGQGRPRRPRPARASRGSRRPASSASRPARRALVGDAATASVAVRRA